MERGWWIICLAAVLAVTFAVGLLPAPEWTGVTPGTAWAQPEDEEEEEPVQAYPNPMERPADLSEPAMMPGTSAVGQGQVMDDGEHGDGIALADGRQAQIVGGRLLIVEGSRKVIAPDGIYQLSDGRTVTVLGGKASLPNNPLGDPFGSSGAMQSGGPVMPPDPLDKPSPAGMPSGRSAMPPDPLESGAGKLKTLGDDAQSGRPEAPGAGVKWDPTDRSWDPGEKVTLKDGRQAVMEQGAGGKMQMFLLQGRGKVLAPDGTYQLQGGQQVTVQGGSIMGQTQMQTPGQMRLPGQMR